MTVTQSTDSTYGGAISGTQAVTKAGTGNLTLSATSGYTGATTLSAGTLGVTGDISASSGVQIAPGASLRGTGRSSHLHPDRHGQPGHLAGRRDRPNGSDRGREHDRHQHRA